MKGISVVIPSFNRAHLLEQTIPTYLQDGVEEVWVIDDASTDNTPEVLQKLSAKYPQIKSVRNAINVKQAAAKNRGIDLAACDWIYFGDDDSILYPDSIPLLRDTQLQYNADIVAAKAIYMDPGESVSDLESVVVKRNKLGNPIKNMNKLEVDFTYSTLAPKPMKLAQACFLVKKRDAQKIYFDAESYLGSGYREETDFIIRAIDLGLSLIYDPRAVQINLPREKTSGGSRSSSPLKYELSVLSNNAKFLKKNHRILREHYEVTWSATRMQIHFFISRLPFLSRAIAKGLFPRLYGQLRNFKRRLLG
ncbi:MAG: glycosyltransferase family 2 protein [Luteibaculum sp.]